MKVLNIQIDDSLYDALMEKLKNLPESKIKIHEQDSARHLGFDQAMDYTL